MKKPKTNSEALDLVIEVVGTKTALAKGLGVVKQLVSRWKTIPIKYAEPTAKLVHLPIDWIVPELDAKLSALLKRPSAEILPSLIRLFHPESRQ